ncbi:MAG: hypothetical protein AVDCRST_MAG08-600, partial [uncultured Acetobacteraceae bacterium]
GSGAQGRSGARGVVQGAAVHRRGDPLGGPVVSHVPDQLPRPRADAHQPLRRGRPHHPFPLDPGL